MIEKALKGGRVYWAWVVLLLTMIVLGLIFYVRQWNLGLGITGMGRDISWGLYIANFTFLGCGSLCGHGGSPLLPS
jgi:molybdopterin-containing oxidoreductase family membrane subunit